MLMKGSIIHESNHNAKSMDNICGIALKYPGIENQVATINPDRKNVRLMFTILNALLDRYEDGAATFASETDTPLFRSLTPLHNCDRTRIAGRGVPVQLCSLTHGWKDSDVVEQFSVGVVFPRALDFQVPPLLQQR